MSLEWRNQAALSNYPFTSESTLTDSEGTSRLLRDDIVDLVLYLFVPEEANPYLSSITLSEGNISLQFSCDETVVAEFFGSRAESLGGVGKLTGTGGEERGYIVFGDNDSTFFSGILPGAEVPFVPGEADILGTCTIPSVEDVVTSFVIGGVSISGRVRLKAGTGFQFVVQGENRVVVHAIGAQVAGECDLDLPIHKINGVSPNSQGGILIQEEAFATPSQDEPERQIIRVRQTEYGIIIALPELKLTP